MLKRLFAQKSVQDKFWEWFAKNNQEYFYFERNQDYLFNKLQSELSKVHPDLVFEFSPIFEGGTREFIVSADGIKSVFPVVIDLVSKAPQLDKWNVIAFRQPHNTISRITYENLTVNFDDVFFRYGKDYGQIALELNIRSFYESAEWTGATFILLDTLLGEYHTEMSISSIDKKILNEEELDVLYPITDLPEVLHNYLSEWNN